MLNRHPNLLQRYIAKTLLQTIAMVLFLLLGIGFMIALISEMHYLGRGNYGLWEVFVFVCLSTPGVLYQLFPMICLIGSLLGLGVLAQHRELVCMRASGMSTGAILLAVAKVACVLILFLTVLGEVVAPTLNEKALEHKAIAKSGGQSWGQHKVWLRDGNRFIHIGISKPGPVLLGVTEFDYDSEMQLQAIHYSSKITYDNNQWHYYKRRSTLIQGDATRVERPTDGIWHTTLSPKIVAVMLAEPETLSLPQLHQYIQYLDQNNLHMEDLSRNFWGRIYQPLITILMVMAAVPLIFGPLRSATMGLRIVGGVLLGFLVYLFNELVGHLGIYLQMPIPLMVAMPSVMVSLFVWHMMRRI